MRDVPAVRLNTESADSAASERDAAAEKVAATLATQGGSCRGDHQGSSTRLASTY